MKLSRKIRRSWLKSIPEWMRCFCQSVSKKARRIGQWTIENKQRIKKYVEGACRSVGSACRAQLQTVKSGLQGHSKEWTTALLAAGLVVSPLVVDAAPEGGVVVGGQATITQAGDVTNIAQASQRAAIDWTSFNIAARETVNFQQPNAQSVALNRVLGNNASEIYGHLNANGIVYLSNPNGMLFAPGAQINVAGLIATTSHVDPQSFMNSGFINTNERNAAITNQGSIFASGLVQIEGATAINNGGLVQAQGINNVGGRIILGNAQIVAIDGTLDSGVGGTIDISSRSNIATAIGVASINGSLNAAGGTLAIDADLVGLGGAINLDGDNGGSLQVTAATIMQTNKADVQANGKINGGNISYRADDAVLLSGSMQANGAQGGQVEVLGDSIDLQAAAISATGSNNGGQINIGGDWQGKGERQRATNTYVNSTTVLDVSSTYGHGGTAVVWADNSTEYSGTINAYGATGQGGQVEVSGLGDLLYAGSVNASSGGKLLLDPKNITVAAASSNPFQNTPLIIGQNSVPADTTLSSDFATSLIITSGGDYLVGDGYCSIDGIANVGSIFLFDKTTGALKAAYTGTNENDYISTWDYTTLENNGVATGKYVVANSDWNRQTGAVTLLDPATMSGIAAISSNNSLTGSQPGDQVGGWNSATALANGNYVVLSPNWANGTNTNAGAVTWGSGTAGISGEVSSSNSLVGSQTNDYVGSAYDGESVSPAVFALNNGNYVVASSNWANGTNTSAGAVTWGSGTAGISGEVSSSNSLVGSQVDDHIGAESNWWGGFSSTVSTLENGNYVVLSPNWANGTNTNAGAATWGSGTAGISGEVSSSNSLVGTQANDQVGSNYITELANGNYVVQSPYWANGTNTSAGAVTWGSGTAGISGEVSSSNSLVGSQVDDHIGAESNWWGGFSSTVSTLENGNYVVLSPNWANGTNTNAGAVTWGSGTAGISGEVSSSNSLVGTQANDQVGSNYITELANGNYVVASANWANGTNTSAGAVTWGSGTAGISGEVSSSNSLVGSHEYDQVGNYGITGLANGNYVVLSPDWANGTNTNAGAVTWGSGTAGISGEVSSSNSLVGSHEYAQVGNSGDIVNLSNGNYVVLSPNWANGTNTNAGAVTWGSGTAGISGEVSSSNSLVGAQGNDQVGSNHITELANGNYVVLSPNWANGTNTSAGAVTWGSGTAGISGEVSSSNSLVGSQVDDHIGAESNWWGGFSSTVSTLENGNYVVLSPNWANGTNTNAGAATWGSGTAGISGEVSSSNSLVGTQADDQVGSDGAFELSTGNYVVCSTNWTNGSNAAAGAVTWGSGSAGVSGIITNSNSVLGTEAYQRLGRYGWDDTVNNRIIISTYGGGENLSAMAPGEIDPGTAAVANYAYFAYSNVTGGGSTPAPLDQLNAYATQPDASLTTTASTITDSLNQGTDVTFKANNDITINQNVISTNTTAGAFKLYAGRSININANVTVSSLTAVANETVADGVIAANRDAGAGSISMAAGTTLTATSGVTLNILDGFSGGSMALANISAGSLSINTSASSGGNISQQSGSAIAAGTTTVNAGTNSVTLSNADNDFGSALSVSGGNIAVAAGTMLNVAGINGSGTVMLDYAGIDAAGGITINAGGNIISTAVAPNPHTATMLLNAGTGTFNNMSSATSVQTANGRWRIYAADATMITGTALTGDIGSYYNGPAFNPQGWDEVDRNNNRYVFSTSHAPYTVTATNNGTREYGEENSTLWNYYGFTDALAGDHPYSGGPDFITTAAVSSPVGSGYAFQLSGDGYGASDYNVGFTIGATSLLDGTFNINPAPLHITADAVSKPYGTTYSSTTAFGADGLKLGQTVGGVTPASSGAASGAPVLIDNSYSLIPSNATGGTFDPANYNITYTNGTLEVTPALLTYVSTTNVSREYGDPNPVFTGHATGWVAGGNDGLLSGYTSNATQTSNAGGSYTISAANVTAGSNYTWINSKTDGILTITPAHLTITADNKSMVAGTANPQLTATYSGFKNNDDPSVVSGFSMYVLPGLMPPGTYPILAVGGSSINYIITDVDGTLSVIPVSPAQAANISASNANNNANNAANQKQNTNQQPGTGTGAASSTVTVTSNNGVSGELTTFNQSAIGAAPQNGTNVIASTPVNTTITMPEPVTSVDYFVRANAQSANGNTQAAIADYSKAIQDNQNYAEAYLNRGMAQLTIGQEALGMHDIRQAVLINPDLAAKLPENIRILL